MITLGRLQSYFYLKMHVAMFYLSFFPMQLVYVYILAFLCLWRTIIGNKTVFVLFYERNYILSDFI